MGVLSQGWQRSLAWCYVPIFWTKQDPLSLAFVLNSVILLPGRILGGPSVIIGGVCSRPNHVGHVSLVPSPHGGFPYITLKLETYAN